MTFLVRMIMFFEWILLSQGEKGAAVETIAKKSESDDKCAPKPEAINIKIALFFILK